jgi:hypothetical protein
VHTGVKTNVRGSGDAFPYLHRPSLFDLGCVLRPPERDGFQQRRARAGARRSRAPAVGARRLQRLVRRRWAGSLENLTGRASSWRDASLIQTCSPRFRSRAAYVWLRDHLHTSRSSTNRGAVVSALAISGINHERGFWVNKASVVAPDLSRCQRGPLPPVAGRRPASARHRDGRPRLQFWLSLAERLAAQRSAGLLRAGLPSEARLPGPSAAPACSAASVPLVLIRLDRRLSDFTPSGEDICVSAQMP